MADYSKEQIEIENYVKTWEAGLSQDYRAVWDSWKSKRDIVAKEMKLTGYQIACVTKYELARYLSQNLKRDMGMNENNIDQFAKKRGNTKLFQFLQTMTNIRKEYKGRCSKFLDTFEKKVNALNSKR